MTTAGVGESRQSGSRLLGIPTEIRLAIYAVLVSPRLERFLDLSLGPADETQYVSLRTNSQLTCLSLICKQTEAEISQVYPHTSLTLRTRPTMTWSEIPGPDLMVFVNREPLNAYFEEVIASILASKECAQCYIDFFRDNEDRVRISNSSSDHDDDDQDDEDQESEDEDGEDTLDYPEHKSKSKFPAPAEAIDYPHPQLGLTLTALSVFSPVNEMFQRVKKLEVNVNLLGLRYPYLPLMWIDCAFPNLQCLSVISYTHNVCKFDSSVSWAGQDIDIDFWKFCPAECYGWIDLAKSLSERGVDLLYTCECEYSMKCYDPERKDDYEEPFFQTHDVNFYYTYNFLRNEITAVELRSALEECVCEFEMRFKADLYATLAKEGVKVSPAIMDYLILDLVGRQSFLDLFNHPAWDRPITCPVISRE